MHYNDTLYWTGPDMPTDCRGAQLALPEAVVVGSGLDVLAQARNASLSTPGPPGLDLGAIMHRSPHDCRPI